MVPIVCFFTGYESEGSLHKKGLLTGVINDRAVKQSKVTVIWIKV